MTRKEHGTRPDHISVGWTEALYSRTVASSPSRSTLQSEALPVWAPPPGQGRLCWWAPPLPVESGPSCCSAARPSATLTNWTAAWTAVVGVQTYSGLSRSSEVCSVPPSLSETSSIAPLLLPQIGGVSGAPWHSQMKPLPRAPWLLLWGQDPPPGHHRHPWAPDYSLRNKWEVRGQAV